MRYKIVSIEHEDHPEETYPSCLAAWCAMNENGWTHYTHTVEPIEDEEIEE